MGTISTIYRAEVEVPNDVFERFGHTREYEQVSYKASALVETCGQDRYAEVIEWGEAPTRAQCERFIDAWEEFFISVTSEKE